MNYKLIPSLLFIYGIISLFSYIFTEDIFGSLYLNAIYVLSAFFAVFLGLRLINVIGLKGNKAKIYLLIVIAVFLWFLGEILWSMYLIIFDRDPFPSIIDILYLFSYPLFFIAFWKEYKLNKIHWTTKKIIILLLTTFVFGCLVFYFGVYNAYDVEANFLENIISISYGLADLVLLIMLLLVLMIVSSYQKAKYFMVWAYFSLAVLFTLFADILYALYYDAYEEGIRAYQFIDLLWILGYLFFAQGFNRARDIIMEAQAKLKIKKSE